MRTGFSLKEAASILDIHPRRVTQSLDPTLERVARLWRVDPTRTLKAILEAAEELGAMTERELELRERMLEGRADPAETHPHRLQTGATPRRL